MSTPLADLIEAIEHEIEPFYLPGAIRWTDENLNGAWSAALDRFDRALGQFSNIADLPRIWSEKRIYKVAVIEFLRIYKEQRAQKRDAGFFEGLKQRQGPTV